MSKKLFVLLMILVLAVAACSGSEGSEPEVAVDTAPPTATPTLPPPVLGSVDEQGNVVLGEVPTDATVPDSAEGAMEGDSAEPMPMEPVGPWPRDQFGYGTQSHATIGDPGFAMDTIANQLGMDWAKVQMRWSDVQTGPDSYDWAIWDSIVNEANEHGLHLMLSIVTSPAFTRAVGDIHGPPDDYNQYYNFLRTLLERYPGRIHAIEVWNEQNLDREWQTAEGVKPGPYVQFLQGANETIKSIDPSVIVISGALAPTGLHDEFTVMDDLIWLDQAIEAGIQNHADCLGIHHNGYNIPPNIAWDATNAYDSADNYTFKEPFTNPHHSWSFFSTVDISADKIQAVKPDMKLCVTEFGWASSEGYPEAPQGFGYAVDNTLEEQAQWIVQAFQQMRDSGDVMLAFLFNYDFGNKGTGPTDDPVPYSIIDINGAPRPAFGAVASMQK